MDAKPASARVIAMRARLRAGIGQYKIETSADRLALALSEDGFLKAWDEGNHDAIEAALLRMVETYVASMLDVTP